MDLTQRKLSKKEWASVEVPVSDKEKSILRLIHDGYSNVNIRYNGTPSILSIMKIESTPEIEKYIYIKYFERECLRIAVSLGIVEFAPMIVTKAHQPKKVDLLRLQHMDTITGKQRDGIFEYKLLEMCAGCMKDPSFHLYTLTCLHRANIHHLNKYVLAFTQKVSKHIYDTQPHIVTSVFNDAYRIIEKNPNVLMYEDHKLYDHQKQIFSLFNQEDIIDQPKLVLYAAPTGTGKTLTPLGLSRGFRIIYICAARHVGLALAKAAISMEKCVAFAFGCETASDIRLHYYAAADYTKNRKTGGIFKVDNANGCKVEIMICDIASYLVAMYYMLNFNTEETLVMYWDEPTISLDVAEHSLHPLIQNVWRENQVSKIILSCATLPKENSILPFLQDYRERFDGGRIHTVSSNDCKKTISIVDPQGCVVSPHSLFENYSDVESCLVNCEENGSLLRYMDLREVVRFVQFVSESRILQPEYHVDIYFDHSIADMTMQGIKLYYLNCLRWVGKDRWSEIRRFALLDNSGICRKAGVLLTTTDAHTLTDGPTIFIAEDVEKIGKFYIQQSKIPSAIFESLLAKIGSNNKIQNKMEVLMKALDDTLGVDADKEKKSEKETFNNDAKKLMAQIEAIRADMVTVAMDPMFLPNTRQHQAIWVKGDQVIGNAFVPFIDELTVKEIMETDVDMQMKLLLLLGIGVFATNANPAYMEIMKRLSTDQRLYLIIASSDYIYGTNYQLCHAFLGKDLMNMTQQKIIQALGRVGRGAAQQEYTVRFRDSSLLSRLFLKANDDENLEAIHMNSWVKSL